MCFFFSFLPATAWLIVGFFVLFTAARANGGVQTFGRALGIWVLIIAVLFPIVGAYMTVSGTCPMPTMMERMHGELGPHHDPGADR